MKKCSAKKIYLSDDKYKKKGKNEKKLASKITKKKTDISNKTSLTNLKFNYEKGRNDCNSEEKTLNTLNHGPTTRRCGLMAEYR